MKELTYRERGCASGSRDRVGVEVHSQRDAGLQYLCGAQETNVYSMGNLMRSALSLLRR